jgi:nucleoside-diphosphate-sugar epimerase
MNLEPAPARVLVTGAAGIIGRATVEHLRQEGIATIALIQENPGPHLHADQVVVGNAARVEDVALALKHCDAVVHLAAMANPHLGTPYEVYRNNVNSTFNVLAQAGARGIRHVVIASSIQAPGVGLNPHRPMPAYFPLDEQLPYDIADPYSLSKAADELSAHMAARTWGIDIAALRFPLVKSLAELLMIKAAAEAGPGEMMRTGWAYLTVTDAARAIGTALRTPLCGAQVIGLSADDILLERQTAQLLKQFAPQVPLRRAFAGRAALVDTARAERLLGFRPSQSVHDLTTDTTGGTDA